MSNSKVVVAFGATGLQGRSLIQSLSEKNNSSATPWTILALTRSPTSSAATSLAKLPGVRVVQVDPDVMDAPAKAFAATGVEKGKVYGCVSIQGYVDTKTMYRQGCAIGDAAKEWGVQHIVYSSTDVGNTGSTGIADIDVKLSVEKYLTTLFPTGHTYLRPVQFMETWTSPTMQFRMARTAAAKLALEPNPTMKHQLISGRDIGRAGAKALAQGPEWCGGVVRLAGDGLTIAEIEATFKEVLGHPPVYGPTILARLVGYVVPIVRGLVQFYGSEGYGVDIEACRRELPGLENFHDFLIRTERR